MLELKQIEAFFPEHLRPFKRNILREYLQYKILGVIFGGRHGKGLSFMGGTAIHIMYGLPRFSEDLDFDNRALTRDDFRLLSDDVTRALSLEGFSVETGTSFKGVFSADIKITGLLFESGVSGHKEEKIRIKLDAEAQKFAYEPERVMVNKFDVFVGVSAVPVAILLAQKYLAILKRKRVMGRDLYDAIFLSGMAKPDLGYLQEKTGIANMADLKSALLKRCAPLDFKILVRDVEGFLFSSADAKKVLMFQEMVRSWT